MAVVGPSQTKLIDKLGWYNSTSRHNVWDRFSAEEKEQMLADDLAAGTQVSLVLAALITAGLVLCIVTLTAVWFFQ
jgi:hypothetical protein